MTSPGWEDLERLFHGAREHEGDARDAFLRDGCGGDAALRARVEAMLLHHSRGGPFLETPALDVVASRFVDVERQSLVGRDVGSFSVVALLGSGGMGDVYRARDRRLRREVALKLLARDLSSDPTARERFRREALAASTLNHPNVCTVYDVFDHEDESVLVMELVDGQRLTELIPAEGLPVATVVRYAGQLADALAHAHGHGIVHRDLKPDNVVVGADDRVKVLDFGIAAIRGESEIPGGGAARQDLTVPGTIAGTVPYLAPELFDRRPADVRSDQWALGVVMYEMTTGRRPFEGSSVEEVGQAIRHAPLPPLPDRVPRRVRQIVERCLEKDPAARYESAEAVRAALERARPEPRRRPRYLLPALGAGLAAAVMLAGWLWTIGSGGGAFSVGEMAAIAAWPSAESGSRFSPNGRWLSFISNRSGTSRLWLRNLGGGEPQLVEHAAGTITSATWSPNGERIAYVTQTDGRQTIQTVPAFAEGAPVEVSQAEGPTRLVRWIGDRLFVEISQGRLATVAIAGGAMQIVDTGLDTSLVYRKKFDVTADGRRVVFAAQRAGQDDLWIGDLTTGRVAQLTNDRAIETYPVWGSRDGVAVYFQSARGGQLDIWRTVVADKESVQVTVSGEDEIPNDATLDGGRLSYERGARYAELGKWDRATGAIAAGTSSLWDFWPSVAEGRLTTVAFQRRRATLESTHPYSDADVLTGYWSAAQFTVATRPEGIGFLPKLSPGLWLAFLQASPAGRDVFALRLTRLVSKAQMDVTDRFSPSGTMSDPEDVMYSNVVWGPPGQTLYFTTREADGTCAIRRVDADRVVDRAPVESEALAIASQCTLNDLHVSADGRYLAYTRYGGKITELHRYDLVQKREETVHIDEHGAKGFFFLRGWMADGALLALRGTGINEDRSQPLEAIAFRVGSAPRSLHRFDRAFGQTSRRGTGDLYLTMSDQGIHNVYAWSPGASDPRKVTDNTRLGVSYAGLEPFGSGALVFTRLESVQDVYTLVINQAR